MRNSALHVYQCAFQSRKYKSGCFPFTTCPLLAEQCTIVSFYGLFQHPQAENWSQTEKENTVVDNCETAQICLFTLEALHLVDFLWWQARKENEEDIWKNTWKNMGKRTKQASSRESSLWSGYMLEACSVHSEQLCFMFVQSFIGCLSHSPISLSRYLCLCCPYIPQLISFVSFSQEKVK